LEELFIHVTLGKWDRLQNSNTEISLRCEDIDLGWKKLRGGA